MASASGRAGTDLTGVAPVETAPATNSESAPAEAGALSWFDSRARGMNLFQAVRLLECWSRQRRRGGRPQGQFVDFVRFLSSPSLAFPGSEIEAFDRAILDRDVPAINVAAFGLAGPLSALPFLYTELIIQVEQERENESGALRAWLDVFGHRLGSLFYLAWSKYRFFMAFERGDAERLEPDAFTRSLFSLVGLGMPALRKRLAVRVFADDESGDEVELASINDLALLRYAGLLSKRPRSAAGLERLLSDFFGLPAGVKQFVGQWLPIALESQSRMVSSDACAFNCLGSNAVLGESVWDVVSKVCIVLGPLDYATFLEFLPDRTEQTPRKRIFMLSHLIRLYLGLELDFDIQLVLRRDEVPHCRLGEDDGDGVGSRLGWNAWLAGDSFDHDAGDAVFCSDAAIWEKRQQKRS